MMCDCGLICETPLGQGEDSRYVSRGREDHGAATARHIVGGKKLYSKQYPVRLVCNGRIHRVLRCNNSPVPILKSDYPCILEYLHRAIIV